MDNLFFLNNGSSDARIKLVSEDGASIETSSNGAVYKDGNNLSFCIQKPADLPPLQFLDDSGVVYLHGDFTIALNGITLLDQSNGISPSHKVNAANLQAMIDTEYADYIQVEVPEDAVPGDVVNGIPYPFIFKTKYREMTLKIYRLGSESSIVSSAIDAGVNATWIDPDTSNGAMFCFGDNVTPTPEPLTYIAYGNTSLVISPLPGESVRMMVDWGNGWLNQYDIDTPLTQIDYNVTNTLKTVKVYFDRPIERLLISKFIALTEWGNSPYSNIRFSGYLNNPGYVGRYVPTHLASFITDASGMFADNFSDWRFNDDISMWDVSHVTNMERMFFGATNFNQDLSNWCVSNILEEPSEFAVSSSLTAEHKPVWGTCPNGS